MWNSLLLAIGSATIIMLVTSVICWIVVKTRLPGRWLLDNIASLPMVFPGLVLGLAIMILYLYLPIGVYGTIWIMLIAYVTRFMPYGLRYNTTSMLQIHKELEESAAMSGASWVTTFWRIILPLLKPGLLAGWIYIVIVSVRELSSSILLYSPGTEVMSILIWELWENGQYVELSALGVMLILALFVLVLAAQWLGRRFGIREASGDALRHGLCTDYVSDRGEVVRAAQDVSFEVPAGKLFTLARAERLRQDHDAALDRGPRASPTPARSRSATTWSSPSDVFVPPNRARARHGVPVVRHLAAHDACSRTSPSRCRSAKRIPRQEIRERVTRVLKIVDLGDLAEREATKLSGGQQQRLALARALVMEPRYSCSMSRCPTSTRSCASACASS